MRGYRRLRSRLSPLCPDTLWHVAFGPYSPRCCGKMAMEYGAEPSYSLSAVAWGPWHMAFGPWPSTVDWFHSTLGLQNRITLPIAASARARPRRLNRLVGAFERRLATQSRQRAPQSRPHGAQQSKVAKKMRKVVEKDWLNSSNHQKVMLFLRLLYSHMPRTPTM